MICYSSKSWLRVLIFTTSASFSSGLIANEPPSNNEPSLNVIPVTYHKVDRQYIVDGVVEPVNQATIAAQTSGQVLEVNFDVDDFVKKGTVLVRLKSIEQKASLNQVQARVSEAKAYLNAAQKEYDRVKKLRVKRVVSAALLDKTEADLEASKARLTAAKADVRQVKQRVDYTTVKAPYSGIVLERHIQQGEIASLGQPIMTGFSPNKLRAVVTVPQSRIVAIRQHKKAQIILNVEPEVLRFKGKKLTIAPYADAKTHTFRIRVYFPRKAKGVYPGMFTKVAFVVGQEKLLVIPASSIAYRGEVRAVYIVDDKGEQISMRQIRLGKVHEEMIEILAGLEEGEKIATNPVEAAIMLKTQRNQQTILPTEGH
ncbi:efflux RND transporter periplasmic adaptor subunit [Candidatus Parabeggiatoa sp. HSG14]|uniref:efflux RND transporter periplasmic adaptor subunit n=1 Tax=Candidatus Parabeggiatoa sp. HSG14 TaxID=3055593 RepID=UPI0025A7A42A|nr:efflux RND transporter periplasmic adaptor subunit [Thiotrichales bacterium HSG14]